MEPTSRCPKSLENAFSTLGGCFSKFWAFSKALRRPCEVLEVSFLKNILRTLVKYGTNFNVSKISETPSQHREGVFFDILIICWKLQGGHERQWKHHFESILNKLVKCGTKYNLSEDLGAPSWHWEGFSQNFKQILEALGRPWEAWEKTFKIY